MVTYFEHIWINHRSFIIDKIIHESGTMYEPNEITAFGFFNFDVKLTMSVSTYIMIIN